MNTQSIALALFFLLSAGAITGFVVVIRSVRQPTEVPYEKVAGLRRKLFFLISGMVAVFLALTLPLMPYPDAGTKPERVVHVRARQFLFEFSDQPFTEAALVTPVAPVRAGELVEYRVSSADVTHGFGIYTPAGDLLSQVQAMPGYVNRLRLRFPSAGSYPVLCLEYCGVAHHVMQATVEVSPATAPSPD